MNHEIEFIPSGRGKAQCDSNPDYPNGIHISLAHSPYTPTCLVDLPYPAPECGVFAILCTECKLSIAVTAAGRPDDPKSIALPCKKKGTE